MRLQKIVIASAFILVLSIPAAAQYRSMMFERFTIENGLSNNSVNSVLQTKDGFLWIATKDGLNRYDGQLFKHYKHNPADKNSLPENYVNSLLESSDGRLLIGTWGRGCVYTILTKKRLLILKKRIRPMNLFNVCLKTAMDISGMERSAAG